MPKIGCPNCQAHRCKHHKVTPFSMWWLRYVLNNYQRVRYALIALIKGENK